jgi:hypothetical protein
MRTQSKNDTYKLYPAEEIIFYPVIQYKFIPSTL